MNNEDYTRALTVYVPPQNLFNPSFFEKIFINSNIKLTSSFTIRKKYIALFYAISFVFMLFGALVAIKDFAFYSIVSKFYLSEYTKYFISLYLVTLIIFGLTCFGRAISIICNCVISFYIGSVLLCVLSNNFNDYIFLVTKLVIITIVLSCILLVLINIYLYSKKFSLNNRSYITFKSLVFYLISNLLVVSLIYFIL